MKRHIDTGRTVHEKKFTYRSISCKTKDITTYLFMDRFLFFLSLNHTVILNTCDYTEPTFS